MQLFTGLFWFYRKIFFPTALVSIVLGWIIIRENPLTVTGLAYLATTPFMLFFIYEIRNPNEYYYYYNLGLGKIALWTGSVFLSLIPSLILILL